MTEISFEVRGYPVPQGSTRTFVIKGRAVTTNRTPKLDAWRTAIAQEARNAIIKAPPSISYGFQLLEGALEVECAFTFTPVKSRRKQGKAHFQRPDIDKLLRAVLDACTGVIYHDDAQVMKLIGMKEYGSSPGCRIKVKTC